MRIVRTVGIGVGLLLMAGGLAALFYTGVAPALVFAFEGLVIVFGVAFERATYKAIEAETPGAGWTRTPERFLDNETGTPVTVYVQAASGERKYVSE